MKGIVFTELMEMVVSAHGDDVWDDVLDGCDLESGGAYTSAGTYHHTEILQIVSGLSKLTGDPVRVLVRDYGRYLFGRFYQMMPQFFDKPRTVYEFLSSVHGYIHVEVKKLYPDAQLPHFETEMKEDGRFIMIYNSTCPFADFAEGLIHGCIDHFEETIDMSYIDRNTEGNYQRIFTMVKHDEQL